MTGDQIKECGKTRLQAMIEKLWTEAEKGNLKAMEMIFDRLEGKPAQITNVNFENPVSGVRLIKTKDV